MAVIDVDLIEESQNRYLTYALSVINSRALPDVRDGLKPVQRRILYAMLNNLHLTPEKPHRKSAAVVGEVLARYHPHGDAACYEAMVRLAQDFSVRYPLVDGQGNFGSLDGDSAAAYRYTEAKLTKIALEVIGDIGEKTVEERDNFDQTVFEPVVLPSRLPHLLMNGTSGIAVGMATSIPPHNLGELIKAILLLLEDSKTPDAKIYSAIKGPDFPTACSILNSKSELKDIYSTGRGAIRMRGDYKLENIGKGRQAIVVTSIPYAVDKSNLIEKIADLIIARKLPQILDVRDESTAEIRVVLELAKDADAELAMAYIYKNTPLQQNFNVNLTALVPTENPYSGKPELLSLRRILEEFVTFRVIVTRRKLEFEREKLEKRIHLLEGLVLIFDAIEEVIRIVRKSSGRTDAAEKLQKRFKLSADQAFFIVDLRIYQLSKTSIDEIEAELKEKQARVAQINKLLKSEKALKGEISKELSRLSSEFSDKRRSQLVYDFEEPEVNEEDFVQHEDAHVIVTQDGWIKRIRTTNDPNTSRLREGDSIFFTQEVSTKDVILFFTNKGNMFGQKVYDVISTTGYGEPVQKTFKFSDGEQIVAVRMIKSEANVLEESPEVLFFTKRGYGFRMSKEIFSETKKNGKRVARVSEGDELAGIIDADKQMLLCVSTESYGVYYPRDEVPILSSAGKGVILQKIPKEDVLVSVVSLTKKDKIHLLQDKGKTSEVGAKELTIAKRAQRGVKLVKRGKAEIIGVELK